MFDPRLELYTITDQASARGRTDLEVARGLILGGATCLQYRAKRVSAAEQARVALQLAELCRASGTAFIVNDRLDLALAMGADGLHVGQDDLPLALLRELAAKAGRSDLLIGKSTHSLEQALAAEAEGADYIGCGPVYATQTKENNVAAIGVDVLRAVRKAVRMPVVAIGGIKAEQLAAVAITGTEHVAVVTALTGAEEVALETERYRLAWSMAKKVALSGVGAR